MTEETQTAFEVIYNKLKRVKYPTNVYCMWSN